LPGCPSTAWLLREGNGIPAAGAALPGSEERGCLPRRRTPAVQAVHEVISLTVLSHKLKGGGAQREESDWAGSCRLLPFVLFCSIRESQRLSEE